MNIIDRRHQALGGQGNDRTIAQITHLVIHHTTGARTNTTADFERGWRTNSSMGAPNNARGGYHEVILANGDVERNYDDRRMVWGARNQNSYTWHIALVGQHGAGVNNITQTQLRSLERRIAKAYRRLGITSLNRIVVHHALPGQATACTAINMANVRTAVGRLLQSQTTNTTRFMNTAVPLRSRASANSPRVKTLSIGQEVSLLGNTASGTGSLGDWTNVRVGNQDGWVRAARLSTTRPATSRPTIDVGSRVKVNANARTWATGQTIPTWVHGQTYTVQQLRNNNNELLLAGVVSWIRRTDVTLV